MNAFEKPIDRIVSYRKGFEKEEAKQLKKAIASGLPLLVAEQGEKIIACCIARHDKWRKKFAKNNWTELSELFVEKKYRKKGIATKMIKQMEKMLEGKCDGTELFAIKGNKKAIALYKKLGYRETIIVMLKKQD